MNLQDVISLLYLLLFLYSIYAILRRRSQVSVYWAAVVVPVTFPVAILLATFLPALWRGDALLRVSQLGYRIGMEGREAQAKRITLGGNRQDTDAETGEAVDDVFINGLPGNFASVTAGTVGFQVSIPSGAPSRDPAPSALVEIDGRLQNCSKVGRDAKILIAGPGGRERSLSLDYGAPFRAPSLISEGKALDLLTVPARLPLLDLPLPLSRPFTQDERIYPLRDALVALGAPEMGQGLHSFLLARRTFPWFDFYLAILDSRVRLQDGDSTVHAKTEFEISKIERLRFLRVDDTASRVSRLTAVGPITFADNAFEVGFPNPRRVAFRYQPAPSPNREVATLYLAGFEPPPGMDSVVIPGSSQLFESASGILRLLPRHARPAELRRLLRGEPVRFEVIAGNQVHSVDSGQELSLGSEHAIHLVVEQIELPIQLIAWILLAATIQLLLMRAVHPSPTIAFLLAVANLLLALRLLLSFKAATLRPFSSEAVVLSLYALLLVPCLLISSQDLCCRLRGDNSPEPRQRLLLVTTFLVLSASFTLASLGFGPGLILGFALPIIPLAISEVAGILQQPRRGGISPLKRILIWAQNFASFRQVVWAGLLLTGLRLIAWILGYREALVFGGRRLAFEMLYTPALVILTGLACGLIAYHFTSVRERHATPPNVDPQVFLLRRTPRRLLVLVAVLALALAVVGFLVSDLGMVVPGGFGCLAVLAGTSLALMKSVWGQARSKLFLRLTASLGLLLLFLAAASPWLALAWASAHADNPASLDRNRLRLLAQFSPALVQDLGTRSTQEILETRVRIDAYAGQQPARYLGTPMLDARPTDLNDHAVAVYLLSDFGWAGGLLLLTTLLAPLPLLFQTPEGARASPLIRFGGLRLIAVGCLFTLCFTGLFMAAANLGAVPLTGKNVFFLGLNSAADLVTGLTLLWLAAVTLESQRWIDELS